MLEETTGVTNPEPWPLPHRTDLRDRLVTAYSTGRGYHDLLHLTEVLARIVELGAGDNLEVVLAAWYHDAVAGVAGVVRLTEHHQREPGDRNGEVLTDADLAILAADPDRYRAYAEGVRREYAGYDDAAFAAGRTAILQALLGKPTLFHTAHAREHWEQVARANVEAEINRLSAG